MRITYRTRGAAAAAALTLSAAGCSDFLTGEGVNGDPNQPNAATTQQLFVATQAAQFGQYTAGVAQYACVVVQHCAGIGNYLEQWNQYNIGSGDHTGDFSQIYLGAGLVDLREIQNRTEKSGDRLYAGIAKVWEALTVSFGADNWGDIPYRDTHSGTAAPELDPQLQVYEDLQTLLTEAIADLQAGGTGPGGADLVFDNNVQRWVRAANTLKARLYLHTAEVPSLRATAYANAITAATAGINEAPAIGELTGPGDWTTYHTSATSERNMWYQFATSTFGAYLVANKFGVDLLKARNDTVRLRQYYSAEGGQRGGFANSGTSDPVISKVATLAGDTRINATYRHPLVTWAENELILAEAKFMTSGQAAAQPHLDAVRARRKLSSVPATLQAIAEEQYVEYFQQIESWHSYKRHCWPNLVPNPSGVTTVISARLYYGTSEANANLNVPGEAEQNSLGGVAGGRTNAIGRHNPNDPAGGLVTAAGACRGN
jgi:hypothetical protein